MARRRFSGRFIRLFLINFMVLATIFPSFTTAQSSQQRSENLLDVNSINLMFPFEPGSEWQTTSGWEAWNHQQAWNWNALDFVPVGRDCLGEPILAAAQGTIRNVNSRSLQHEIEIEHTSGYRTLYAHLDTLVSFAEGQVVAAGTKIGTCGGYFNGSPNTYTPHLHFQLFMGPEWTADDGIIPTPIDGITDQNRLTSSNTGLYSHNTLGSPPTPPPSSLPVGYIDSPSLNSIQSAHVQVVGWTKVSGSTIARVEIWLNGLYYANATYGDSRPDAGGNFGWHWTWPTADFGNGSYQIRVKAVAANGGSAFLISSTLPRPDTVAVTVANNTHPCLKALYRYNRDDLKRHFYTSNWSALKTGDGFWKHEGVTGYIAKDSACHISNALPLYRFWSASRSKHFYTTNRLEGSTAGFTEEGIEGYVTTSANSQYYTKPVYRLYKPLTNNQYDDHFYTTSLAEANIAVQAGYTNEGIKFYVFDLINKAPNKPTLTAPANNSATVNKTLAFSWNDAGDTDNYPRNFRDYEATVRKVGGTWTQTRAWSSSSAWNTAVPETGQYCWKVQAGDGKDLSGWTAERCLTVYPTVKAVVDSPVANATLARGLTYRLSGWSIQQETPSGTGVDKIHVYLDGPAGSGQLLGAGSYGQERSDIARIYGERFRFSGFSYYWNTTNVSVGPHTLYIYSNSTVTGWSSMTRTVNIVAAKKIFVPLVRK
jgi:hypothetical protein